MKLSGVKLFLQCGAEGKNVVANCRGFIGYFGIIAMHKIKIVIIIYCIKKISFKILQIIPAHVRHQIFWRKFLMIVSKIPSESVLPSSEYLHKSCKPRQIPKLVALKILLKHLNCFPLNTS